MFSFDHIIISVKDLGTAVNNFRSLGFTVSPGGRHANNATHNALILFSDSTYIELMAKTGEEPAPDLPDYSQFLTHEGFIGFALTSTTLEQDLQAMRQRGVDVSAPQAGGRRRPDGVELRWKLAFINGRLNPFFIADETPREQRIPNNPALTTHPNGATSIFDVAIIVDNLDSETAFYEAILGQVATTSEAGTHFKLNGSTLTIYETSIDALPSDIAPHEIAFRTTGETRSLDAEKTHKTEILLVNV